MRREDERWAGDDSRVKRHLGLVSHTLAFIYQSGADTAADSGAKKNPFQARLVFMSCERFQAVDTKAGVGCDSAKRGLAHFSSTHAISSEESSLSCEVTWGKKLTWGCLASLKSADQRWITQLQSSTKTQQNPVQTSLTMQRCEWHCDPRVPHIARPIPNNVEGRVRLYLGRSDADFDSSSVNSCLVWNIEPLNVTFFWMDLFSNNDFARWNQSCYSGTTVRMRTQTYGSTPANPESVLID